MIEPFFKWAGGKRALVPQILDLLPGRINTYFEPFLGGGAILLALGGRYENAICGDMNRELITAWRTVRDSPRDVIDELVRLAQHSTNRAAFEKLRAASTDGKNDAKRSARFLFLVKTSFRGLWRENLAGRMNAPFGDGSELLVDTSVILAAHGGIQQADFHAMDWLAMLRKWTPEAGDAVYLDPPYFKNHRSASYVAGGFGHEDHQRLAQAFSELTDRGVACVASNADTDEVRELYRGHEIIPVETHQAMRSGKAKGKGREVLIRGVRRR